MKQFPLFSLFSKIVRKWPPKDAAYFLPTTTAVWLSTSMCECGWVNKNGRIFWESLRWQMWSPPRSGENKSFTWNRHQAEDWSTFWKIIQNGPFFLNALMVKLGGLLNKCARWRKSRLDSRHYMDAFLWPRGLIWGNQGACLFEFH